MFTYTAFEEFKMIGQGNMETVALAVKARMKANKAASVLIFSDLTGRQIDLDLSGTDKQVLERLKVYASQDIPTPTGAGRPKLGVIPREISLLPRHWEWLLNQDGGASAVIRNLIDEKIKIRPTDKIKLAQERTYKFLSAIAGNLENFEEATRFLYRKDKDKFKALISGWPKDVMKHAISLSKDVF
ncbi:MAG: DUF2239 family protein [Bdellovibrionaceae bacterium]|nr:DUF2239 family protein [Pseudobdellovibrionaceae bacterium]